MAEEEMRKRLEEIGEKFCKTLTLAEIEHMERFIKLYEAGRYEDASRVLESLDFIHQVASKICVGEEE